MGNAKIGHFYFQRVMGFGGAAGNANAACCSGEGTPVAKARSAKKNARGADVMHLKEVTTIAKM
jgi:hypothetical protein